MTSRKLTSAQKKALEDASIITGLDDLIDKKIDKRAIKTERLIKEEGEKTRGVVLEQTELINKIKSSRINDVIQYALVGLIILTMIVLHGCLQNWL